MASTLSAITFDCADAAAQAAFWGAVLDLPVAPDPSESFATVAGTPTWMFLQVPEGKTAKNRVHVDLTVADLDAEVDRVIGLGAKRIADVSEDGERWTTLADPEGNEFDIAAG